MPLPALSSTLSDGTQVANYEGVVVTVSGTLGLTTAQWDQLQTFEHQFSVRQVTAYAVPSSDYGLNTIRLVAADGRVPRCADVRRSREHSDSHRRWSNGLPVPQQIFA